MDMKEKVALFDFCETLVKFQSADRFVFFVCNHYPNAQTKRDEQIYNILKKSHIITLFSTLLPHSSLNKRIILFRLRGFTRKQLQQCAELYYKREIQPHLIIPVIEELQKLQHEGYRIILVSGGYDLYLEYFAKDYGIEDIISTKIQFNSDEVCTGRMMGKDCLWDNKLTMLHQYMDDKHIEIDSGYSMAFSDSRSDMPLLMSVKQPVVVYRKDSSKWYEHLNIKEIIWEN